LTPFAESLSGFLCVGHTSAMGRKAKMPQFAPELLDELLRGYETPEDMLGPGGIFDQLKKALAERALGAELAHHLAQEAATPAEAGRRRNHRNGSSPKTVHTDTSSLNLAIPRDRAGTFAPQLVPKHRRRLPGFDEKVIGLYARGLTVREMQAHLRELYGVDVSPDLISTVTDAVLEEVAAWQQRPLAPLYPVIFFDALRVKIRDEGTVRNKAVYLALGVTPDGCKDVLGLWVKQTEGAKFWLRVMTELQARGVQDVLFAVVDGLKGFPEAINAIFPQATIQTCIVHLLRHSLNYVNWKERRQVVPALQAIYRAPSAAAAEQALAEFDAGPWGQKYPPIAQAWRRQWTQVVPFFAFPVAIRRILYTTNAIESLHMQLRKALKTRGHFPTDESALKLLYLVLRNVTKRWSRAPREWKAAMTQFAILYPDRFTFAG
jgi:putative transposase